MTDRPIIFSAPMVRALLDGRKAQTRRVLKPQPVQNIAGLWVWPPDWKEIGKTGVAMQADEAGLVEGLLWDPAKTLKYAHGDRLWVREAHAFGPLDPQPAIYRATAEDDGWEVGPNARWRPSIHMPRWASRITLTVTDVRVQRLQDISGADAVAEGVQIGTYGGARNPSRTTHRQEFSWLWDRIHGPDAWAANPWVVALTFTVQHGNIDMLGDK